MKSTSEFFAGRRCFHIIVDRFNNSKNKYMPIDNLIVDSIMKPIEGRVFKSWNDRTPNWQPNDKGEYKNDYFYGGDLQGIKEMLPYIKNMGFNMIFLSPLDESEEYHHYDVGNQSKIDPWLGDWDDLESLCIAADLMGIAIIVDVVFNHTSKNSIYVKQHPEWYKKDGNGKPVCWFGFDHLYEIDTTNPSYITEMKKVLRKYLQKRVSGFRFDLGMNLSKEFLYEMKTLKNEFPHTIFILEMWEIASTRDDPKIFDGQTDSLMNYPMADAILRWSAFGNYLHFEHNFKEVYTKYPKHVRMLLLNNIGTHDTPMTMSMLAGIRFDNGKYVMNENTFNEFIWDIEKHWRHHDGSFDTYAFRLWEALHDDLTPVQKERAMRLTMGAMALMYTLEGIPCVYQGVDVGDVGFKDPFSRKPYNWYNPDLRMRSFVTLMNSIHKNNEDIYATADSGIATSSENLLIIERFDYKGKRMVTAVSRSEMPMYINIKNDCSALRPIFATGNSNKNVLDSYGILIAREN